MCNAYPSYQDIYKNGFIHRRVKSYIKFGLDIEVFCLHQKYEKLEIDIYDGIKVIRGNKEQYVKHIKTHDYLCYLIHFIEINKYRPIIENIENPKIVIWIHGAEVENWHRRWFDFLTNKQKLKNTLFLTSKYYPDRIKFLHEIYTQDKYNITFIYVSRWFKENVADVDAKASPQNYAIIPNVIDGELFEYEKKSVELRKKILSIRPFANMKYGNDLTVKAILHLSEKPYFKDLEFSIYGDGEYFDSILSPIMHFENVKISKKFLTQQEISEIHKEYGIFICPTRWDSQGVSMCEAMSSGLVPISNDITAIPEFVTHNRTGLLAYPESGISLANQIEKIYLDEQLFLNLSKNAATEIRKIADENVVIAKELEVILSE